MKPMDLTRINEYLASFHELIQSGEAKEAPKKIKVGVDLGTANIVITVVDENNHPIAGAAEAASVVKDGIVVDYIGAVRIVKRLKAEVEHQLGIQLTEAATAIPPGIAPGDTRAITNVVESAGFEVIRVLDEPTAAAVVLGITEGAVVDVGGGTTGISILHDGKVVAVEDEPTGGTHMSLVIAGNYGISFEEAEVRKRSGEQETELYPLVRPVVEKMATIVKRAIDGHGVSEVYVVGGAATFEEFEKDFEKILGIPVVKPNYPLLVTPIGIAWGMDEEVAP
jgi:ethanolamine utilization protein EutJ